MKTHLAVVSECPLGSNRHTQCRESRAEVEGLAGSFEMGAGFALVKSLLYFSESEMQNGSLFDQNIFSFTAKKRWPHKVNTAIQVHSKLIMSIEKQALSFHI